MMISRRNLLSALFFISLLFGSMSMSAQELYLVFLNSNPNKLKLPECDVNALQQGHLDNIGKLYDEGKLLLAGPFDGGGGIFVLKARSYEEAKGYLDTDPAIAADRFIVETLPFGIQKGMICEQVKPYEMIQLNFIEFSPEKDSDKKIPYLDQMDYAKQDEVIFSAAISYDDDSIGYIMVLPLETDAEKFAGQAPVVKEGTHNFNVKAWWTTDQTFCDDENKKIN